MTETNQEYSSALPPPCEVPGAWPPPAPPRRLLLHVTLFVATILTTTTAGALLEGVNLVRSPWLLYRGLPFSLSLLAILTAHEMGHYLVSRRHGLEVSLPYFLPGLPLPPLPGTFGALIRIRSPILDKRALLDVGISGPLAGMIFTVPILAAGLLLSRVLPPSPGVEESLQLGEPLLFRALSYLILGPVGADDLVLLHPVAFAGWLGLFITSLNLLPVGQLDGGHVMFALFPAWHRVISLACLVILGLCGIFYWPGWLLWAGIMAFLGVRHPPPACAWITLNPLRQILGVITIIVFLLTFTPVPFKLG
uniref:Site-2 protease family protein n=1 Tax=Desulfobacca acetoxidans TaxID=60893 RepID=A0A7V4LDB7_9BACT